MKEVQKNNHDWLPDWRDESEYPNIKKATSKEWAWEFLRRNPEYQKQWDKEIAPYFDSVTCSLSSSANKNLVDDIKKKFGISKNTPPDYRQSNSEISFISNVLTFVLHSFYPLESEPTKHSIDSKLGEIVTKINLRYPVKPQVDVIASFARSHQKLLLDHYIIENPNKRKTLTKYNEYLRILDAKSRGIKDFDIAKVLYPKFVDDNPDVMTKRVNDSFQRAKELRDCEYLFIASFYRK